jgi:hypothetical protein
MNTAMGKVCAGCGIDVSQQKRVKDAAGNYYCESCVQTVRQRQEASAQRTRISSAPSASSPPPSPPRPQEYMRYTITGVARETGRETNLELEAASEKEAVAEAKARGILVTGCKPYKKVPSPRTPQGETSVDAGPANPRPSTKWDRFLRGGLLGLLDERFCVSKGQMTVLGSTKRQKALRLTIIVGATIVVFATVIFGVIWIADLASKKPSSISASTGLGTDEQPRRPRRNTFAVSFFMGDWEKGPEFAGLAAEKLDPRAIGAVRKIVWDTALESFDGKINDLGDSTITIFETGEQIPCQEFEVTPVVRMTDSLHMPISYKISVANDTKKVIAVVPSKM